MKLRNPCPWSAASLVLALVLVPGTTRAANVTTARVDHSAYDVMLKAYVNDEGLVNYRAWKAEGAQDLKAYLKLLSATDPARLADRQERLAFWINAYNALTVDAILHFYPLKSIKDKVSPLFGYNVWDDYPLDIAGKSYSLNHIENEVLRPLGDPRIHFALVCASRGCPKLRNEAYAGVTLDEQLDDNVRDFFSSSMHFRIDPGSRKVSLSPILRWFGKDFGASDAAKLGFVRRYLKSEIAQRFLDAPGLLITYLPYDWGLNEQPRSREPSGARADSPHRPPCC